MKYSLRSLMIAVTLAGILFGRVAYLKRTADFHQGEALRFFRQTEEFLPSLPPELRNQMVSVSYQLVPADEQEYGRLVLLAIRHRELPRIYSNAIWRPWTTIDESAVDIDP